MSGKEKTILEYYKIIEILKTKAVSDMGKEKVAFLEPSTDIDEVKLILQETKEAVDLIAEKGSMPLQGLSNIAEHIEYARKNGVLGCGELLEVARNLKVALSCISFVKSSNLELKLIPKVTNTLSNQDKLFKVINNIIVSETEVSKDATPELKRISKEIGAKEEELKKKLQGILNSKSNEKYLQENIFTIKNGRYVIPLKTEYKKKIKGIIQSESSTGSTTFVEPEAVSTLNNDLISLEEAYKREINKILQIISSQVALEGDNILNNQKLLTLLDFIMAKGELSIKYKSEMPYVSEDNVLKVVGGQHPLMDPETTVPISLEIGSDYRLLLITGPNTGGKTVTLKTIGLMCNMVQSGLFVPASSDSVFPVFENILVDIGDEQSIEQSLSTFSGHIKNISNILENANEKTLILLDELGAGTEPSEGAALAISILDELIGKKSLIVGTTHYTQLKQYATSIDEATNGSMEFDIETLKPTYRLLMGIPGKSNAFEISRRLGIDDSIIDRAEELIDKKDASFEDAVSELQETRKEVDNLRDEALSVKISLNKDKAIVDEEKKKIEEERSKIIDQAKKEARNIIYEARVTVSEIDKEIKAIEREKSRASLGKLNDIKGRLREIDEKNSVEEEVQEQNFGKPLDKDNVVVGKKVYISSIGNYGEILAVADNDDNITVGSGNLRIKVKRQNLVDVEEDLGVKKTESIYSPKKAREEKPSIDDSVKPSIDIRGYELYDAEVTVSDYIDKAYMAGIPSVHIIHGKGEGILRTGISQALSKNELVVEYHLADYANGGAGVTIATLKTK